MIFVGFILSVNSVLTVRNIHRTEQAEQTEINDKRRLFKIYLIEISVLSVRHLFIIAQSKQSQQR
jgi:hypothetical protein